MSQFDQKPDFYRYRLSFAQHEATASSLSFDDLHRVLENYCHPSVLNKKYQGE